MADPLLRPAARVVVLDPDDRVLLQKVIDEGGRSFWITPGGGIDPGEDAEQAVHREVEEELGLTGVDLGPQIWKRRHVFDWAGVTYDQREVYFLVRLAEPVDAATTFRPLPPPEDVIVEHRWWTVSELDEATDTFAPRRLGELLRKLLDQGPPPEPIDTGI